MANNNIKKEVLKQSDWMINNIEVTDIVFLK